MNMSKNDLTSEQLKLIGICNNEAWLKHRGDHGYIDGEGFEVFYKRKQGYGPDQHETEINKRNFTTEERLIQVEGLAHLNQRAIEKILNCPRTVLIKLRESVRQSILRESLLRESPNVPFSLFPDSVKGIKDHTLIDNALYVKGGSSITIEDDMSKFTLFLVMKMKKEGPLFCGLNDNIIVHRIGFSSSMLSGHHFQSEVEDCKLHLYSLTFNFTNKSYFYGIDDEVLKKVDLKPPKQHYPWTNFILGYGGTGYIYDMIYFPRILTTNSIERIQNILCSAYELNNFHFD